MHGFLFSGLHLPSIEFGPKRCFFLLQWFTFFLVMFNGSNVWHYVSYSRYTGQRWHLSIFRRESLSTGCRSRRIVTHALLWNVWLFGAVCVQSGRTSQIGSVRRNASCYSECNGHIHMVTTARSIRVTNQQMQQFNCCFEYQLAQMVKMVHRSVWFIIIYCW